MPEKHDANESFTIVEQRTAFGNLNIGVSFDVHRSRAQEIRSRHAHYEDWTRSQSGEESSLLRTVFAAFGDNIAHLRQEEKS